MGDVDGLKAVNDRHGHGEGDEFLTAAAEVFNSATTEEHVVARIGGDEFAAILPDTTFREAERMCNQMKDECRAVDGKGVFPEPFSMSFGYATRQREDRDLKAVFERADDRMLCKKDNAATPEG